MPVTRSLGALRSSSVAVVGTTLALVAGIGIGYLAFGRDEGVRASSSTTYRLVFRGDENGVRGTLRVDLANGKVCATANLPWARAAQVHRDVTGPAEGVANPVVVTLFESPGDFSRTACAEGVDSGVSRDILRRPQDYYVDYHKDGAGRFSAWSPLYRSLEGSAHSTGQPPSRILEQTETQRFLGGDVTFLLPPPAQNPVLAADDALDLAWKLDGWAGADLATGRFVMYTHQEQGGQGTNPARVIKYDGVVFRSADPSPVLLPTTSPIAPGTRYTS